MSSDASNLKRGETTRSRPWPEGNPVVAYKRKLIEVSIPLAAINEQSAREKQPFTRNHPRSLHIWWARRPHVAARAILFAQLIDDPSSNLERFPTVEIQRVERERLHSILRRLVIWENSNDPDLLSEVRAELNNQFGEFPPRILDPFAGGGTIPLEAQRLGLEAHASDLNPVAVLINKALIEIPPTFSGSQPVFPGAAEQRNSWPKVTGLAEDIRQYGQWMLDEAGKRFGDLFPRSVLVDGSSVGTVAWIWARTVRCPNPACGIEMPLVRSWWLGKRKGKEAYIVPAVENGKVYYSIGHDVRQGPDGNLDGTVGRTGGVCISCKTAVALDYIREQSRTKGLGAQLMAIVAEGNRSKVYLPPNEVHTSAALVTRPEMLPSGPIPDQALSFRVQRYGMTEYVDLFTNRQLAALTALSDLVQEARAKILADSVVANSAQGARLEEGGSGAAAYADAVATYLGIALSRYTDMDNALCSWNSTNENVRALFSRQAIPMTWDFVEVNPLGNISLAGAIEAAANSIGVWDSPTGSATQADASTRDYAGYVVSTDPPYYDNIGYSDLSDFFYVWLRDALGSIHPKLLSTMQVPKADELVANPYRHGGVEGARQFFEVGFEHVFERARASANSDYPMTVYYAFKQAESDEGGTASTGWETILGSMIHAGWTITATWPIRSERVGRSVGLGTNALASSVVLALRPREAAAATTDRRGFIAALKLELAPALRDLQSGGISPVDLPQAAIGPGMAVYSRYASVIESDGRPMPVRSALAHVNEMLDELLTEQEGDFDAITRFALAWYRGHGYESAPYGDAEDLARARGTAVSTMERSGILTARAGRVELYRPSGLASDYDVRTDTQTSAWEALHHAIRVLEATGITAAGLFLQTASRRADGAVDLNLVKELAYLVFQVAEKNGWSKDAQSFNDIATSWGDLLQAERLAASVSTSVTLDFEEDE
jgi:putative DNA methylase